MDCHDLNVTMFDIEIGIVDPVVCWFRYDLVRLKLQKKKE